MPPEHLFARSLWSRALERPNCPRVIRSPQTRNTTSEPTLYPDTSRYFLLHSINKMRVARCAPLPPAPCARPCAVATRRRRSSLTHAHTGLPRGRLADEVACIIGNARQRTRRRSPSTSARIFRNDTPPIIPTPPRTPKRPDATDEPPPPTMTHRAPTHPDNRRTTRRTIRLPPRPSR